MTTLASILSAREIATRCLLAIPNSRSFTLGSMLAPIPSRISTERRSISGQSIKPKLLLGACPRKIFSATDNSSNKTVS